MTNTTTPRIGVSYHGRGKVVFYKAIGTFESNGRTCINWQQITEAEATCINWQQITEAEAMRHYNGKTPFDDLG